MFRYGIIAAVLAVMVSGCSRSGEQRPSGQTAGQEAAAEQQSPYYYGLIEEYKRLLVEDPDNLAALVALGNAYYDSGHWKESVIYYERALRIDPDNADIRTDMGTAYRNMGMPERALTEYRKALEYNPGHQNARYNMGIVYAYDKRDYRAAIRIWEDLLKMSPNHPHSEQMRSCIITFKKVVNKEDR